MRRVLSLCLSALCCALLFASASADSKLLWSWNNNGLVNTLTSVDAQTIVVGASGYASEIGTSNGVWTIREGTGATFWQSVAGYRDVFTAVKNDRIFAFVHGNSTSNDADLVIWNSISQGPEPSYRWTIIPHTQSASEFQQMLISDDGNRIVITYKSVVSGYEVGRAAWINVQDQSVQDVLFDSCPAEFTTYLSSDGATLMVATHQQHVYYPSTGFNYTFADGQDRLITASASLQYAMTLTDLYGSVDMYKLALSQGSWTTIWQTYLGYNENVLAASINEKNYQTPVLIASINSLTLTVGAYNFNSGSPLWNATIQVPSVPPSPTAFGLDIPFIVTSDGSAAVIAIPTVGVYVVGLQSRSLQLLHAWTSPCAIPSLAAEVHANTLYAYVSIGQLDSVYRDCRLTRIDAVSMPWSG